MDPYVFIARKAIEKYVGSSRKLNMTDVEANIPKKLQETLLNIQAGAFVSIHKNGSLRGCIGTIGPTAENLFDEIVYSAISACSSDPRFNPVRKEELSALSIKVDRLYPIVPIDGIYELDVFKYGVIVEKGRLRGLLLPNLEGVDTVEQQVAIAMDKAGLSSIEGVKMYRFEVERHSED